MNEILIVFRDYRKRLLQGVSELRYEGDRFAIRFIGEQWRASIPSEAVAYIGPPGPWEGGSST